MKNDSEGSRKGKNIGKNIVIREKTLQKTQTMIKHLLLTELQVILYCSCVEGIWD